jgi:hypothetical protein
LATDAPATRYADHQSLSGFATNSGKTGRLSPKPDTRREALMTMVYRIASVLLPNS